MGRKKKTKYIPAPTGEDLERIEAGEKFSDITAGPVKKAISGALNEDISELEELTETEVIEEPRKKRKSKKRIFYFWTGILVSVMSIIGLVFTVNFGINQIKRITDNTDQKNEFKKYVYPLVVIDSPTFEHSGDLPNEVMLRAAAWSIIINYDEKHSEYKNQYGFITVPESDIEVAATKLFGKGISFSHQTLGDPSLYFEYNTETKSYVLPVAPNINPYRPGVTDIKKLSDEKYEIKVGYYPQLPDWMPETKKNKADKYLIYTIEKNGKSSKIISIKENEK